MPDAPPSPRKRFVFGFVSPLLAGVLTFLILGDFFAIAAPGVLGLLLVVGLWAGLAHGKWAFLLGLLTSAVVCTLAYVGLWRFLHRG